MTEKTRYITVETMLRTKIRKLVNNFRLNRYIEVDCTGSMPKIISCPRIVWKIFMFPCTDIRAFFCVDKMNDVVCWLWSAIWIIMLLTIVCWYSMEFNVKTARNIKRRPFSIPSNFVNELEKVLPWYFWLFPV